MSVPIILRPGQSQGESYAVLDDALLIRLYNSLSGATFKVVARVLDPSGVLQVVQKDLTTTSDRSQQITRLWLPTGELLAASVIATAGTPRRGQSWAVVAIESTLPRGVTTLCPLAQGYITADGALLWPGGPHGSSVDGPGMLRSVLGTDPAAGAEIIETVPPGARWRVRSVRASLVTDATAPGRSIYFWLDDGTTRLMLFPSGFSQAASLTRYYNLGEYAYQPAAGGDQVYFSWPLNLYLFQGWRIGTLTTSLVAGDNWGAPQMMVEEWIEE